MKSFDLKTATICLLAAALVILWLAPGGARAGGDTEHTDKLIAVTGQYGSNAAVLYLIDAETRHMAVYRTQNGRSIELVAARRFEHDLKLVSYMDESPTAMNPIKLEETYRRYVNGRPAPGVTPGAPTDAAGEETPAAPVEDDGKK